MKFRKRVKVFPGFHLNFSNSGISSTIGGKGASINFSKKGAYLNTSIPGLGISSRQKINSIINRPQPEEQDRRSTMLPKPIIPSAEIKSAENSLLTSTSLDELKESLKEVYNDRIELQKEIKNTIREINIGNIKYTITCLFIIGFFIKSLKETIAKKKEYLTDIKEQLNKSFINIDMHFNNESEIKYNNMLNAYKSLLTSEVIWDITSAITQDTRVNRSAASTVVTRQKVKFKFDNIDIIKCSHQAFHFENRNGGDLYIYPAFLIVSSNKKDFALIDLKDATLSFSEQRFLEQDKIPSDSKIISKTWAKVNKNGSKDKRFKDNYEIPVVRYGNLSIKSATGLNETYAFSSYEKSQEFIVHFKDYQNFIN